MDRAPTGLNKLFAPWTWRYLSRVLVLVWAGVFSTMALRAALPLPKPYKGSFPWAMFKSAGGSESRVIADGLVRGSDERVKIPLHEIWHYQRGATYLRWYDHARPIQKRKQRRYQKDREHFAQHLADWMRDEKGVALSDVRVRYRSRGLRSQRISYRPIVEVKIDEDGKVVPDKKKRKQKKRKRNKRKRDQKKRRSPRTPDGVDMRRFAPPGLRPGPLGRPAPRPVHPGAEATR